jgi:fumarylacetoacetate (FAA) hydrolase
MKLATYRDGSRDGQLVVVSRDRALAHFASGIAGRLQSVLDDWNFLSPQLEDLYQTLNQGRARHAFAFDPRCCMAPLPRAHVWALDDATSAESFHLLPGDRLAGAHPAGAHPAGADHPLPAGAEKPGLARIAAGYAVITGDVSACTQASDALASVRLVMLMVSGQGHRLDGEAAAASSWSAFGPLAVTVDELGADWRAGRLQRAITCLRNGQPAAPVDTAADAAAGVGTPIARLAGLRGLGAGAVIGRTVAAWPAGEALHFDAADAAGHSLFGAIDVAAQT